MSGAFVKEPDGNEVFEDLPDRPVSDQLNIVTPEGLARIEETLARLNDEYGRAQVENDRATLARVSRDLRYWSARRSTAQLAPAPPDTAQVHFGSTVTIERDGGGRRTYRIVGEDEADPAHGTLSFVSPVARSLMGKAVGDVVQAGAAEAEIVEIA
jgi:transcription elongation GreA/GreB family factor